MANRYWELAQSLTRTSDLAYHLEGLMDPQAFAERKKMRSIGFAAKRHLESLMIEAGFKKGEAPTSGPIKASLDHSGFKALNEACANTAKLALTLRQDADATMSLRTKRIADSLMGQAQSIEAYEAAIIGRKAPAKGKAKKTA